ncbi:copper-binding protein [Caldimonas thermodepolymerans]|uniref:Copper binding protein CusF n=1 Tax=Caldimonas thermodepolymerans TaxID=215580 RepID=A0AA46DE49_9BURK|nr:copper-binding protein [Caldimonas thermodepolymerans]TCP08027.1 copper binding protein CusF [Caldimonas thermodepolymerans]UZG48848.1 copper-binding protein [Caldimonas thermodepolymerans]
MNKLPVLLTLLAGLLAGPALAQDTDGEVRKIDRAAGKITIKHGEIRNLDVPPMQMVFRAQPPELLDKVQVGDKVRFHAEKVGGTYTITAIEVRK